MSDTDLPGSERPHEASIPSQYHDSDQHTLDHAAGQASRFHAHGEAGLWEQVAHALATIQTESPSRRPDRLLENVVGLLGFLRGRVVDVAGAAVVAERGEMSPAQERTVVALALEAAGSGIPEPIVHEDVGHEARLSSLAAGPDGARVAILFPAWSGDRVARVVYVDAPQHPGEIGPTRRATQFLVRHARITADPDGVPGPAALTPDDLVGAHPRMVALRAELERLVTARTPVVIEGEQGTGKSRVARILHAGRTPREPFVSRSARALGPDGAMIDAIREGLGEAEGGTLHVTDADALATGDLRDVATRVGGRARLLVSVTGEDEAARVARALAPGDVPAVPIVRIPPLSDRPDDAVHLARDLLRAIAARDGVPCPDLTRAARQTILAGPWPGNVDELRARLARAVALAGPGNEIDGEHLRADPDATSSGRGSPPDTFRAETDRFEGKLVGETLEYAGWNVSLAARYLAISRQHLHNLVKKHGLRRKPR